MGLTASSTGMGLSRDKLIIERHGDGDKIIAVAGNPNVGKSTIFNALTGMKQHTGNWPGKTVSTAKGFCKTENGSYILVDIPGAYSLNARSEEEAIARDFICSGGYDGIVIVCDAVCLERNLNLALQILEITRNAVICVNLLDEAERKGIKPDLKLLSERLGVPVVGVVARQKKTLKPLLRALDGLSDFKDTKPFLINYTEAAEQAIKITEKALISEYPDIFSGRQIAVSLLTDNYGENEEIKKISRNTAVLVALREAKALLLNNEITAEMLRSEIETSRIKCVELICGGAVKRSGSSYGKADRRADKILTGRFSGYAIMLVGLCFVFWLTLSGANYLSDYLTYIFGRAEVLLLNGLELLGCSSFLKELVIEGFFRVPSWVTAVMLPPMAVFFPLFTLLEDSGYLPRIAYNLDRPFKACRGCGKQALTVCMGFGCNAAGVVGAKIIDSPRERLLAILTNSTVPCNGRFPAIIAIIGMFFVGGTGFISSLSSAAILTAIILFGVLMSLLLTALLSSTLLKGIPSSYILEMPPYRKPQIGSVIIRSVLDRTVFVLGRAAAVAVPAGFIIWLFANINVNGTPVLSLLAAFLDPFANIMGLDGVILTAFIFGFPANEIVIPLALMIYLQNGSLTEISSLTEIKQILTVNGWNETTAICTVIFSLLHWPCSTTLLTVKKETGSLKWTLIAALLPTLLGITLCIAANIILSGA